MNYRKILASLLALFLACPAYAVDLGGVDGAVRSALRDSRDAGASSAIGAEAVPEHGGPAPKDGPQGPGAAPPYARHSLLRQEHGRLQR